VRSSYIENDYGGVILSLVIAQNPKLSVECGVLDGYSLCQIGLATPNRVVGYDLFEDYKFKNSQQWKVQEELNSRKMFHVKLVKQDALEAAANHEDGTVDFLHIDISNDGDNLEKMFDLWTPKVSPNGLIVFEGGSLERDQIEWMVKYHKRPIAEFKEELPSRGFEYVTLNPFPSMTICRKK
jgi:predicted O-methyltransferase YrrM